MQAVIKCDGPMLVTPARLTQEIAPPLPNQATCLNADCNLPAGKRGLCRPHYAQAWARGEHTRYPLPERPTALQRFFDKVRVTDGCWLWQAAKTAGYGNFTVRKGSFQHAHRWLYQQVIGPVPRHLVLDHLCDTRACVNYDHLQVTTHRVNILRGTSLSAQRARQTACKYGHPFTLENTHIRPNGRRRCRTCMEAQLARYVAIKKVRP